MNNNLDPLINDAISDAIGSLFYDNASRNFDLLATWRECNATHYRVRDSFGSYHTVRIQESGLIHLSYHEDWTYSGKIEPAVSIP